MCLSLELTGLFHVGAEKIPQLCHYFDILFLLENDDICVIVRLFSLYYT